jgi:hypothetical protein
MTVGFWDRHLSIRTAFVVADDVLRLAEVVRRVLEKIGEVELHGPRLEQVLTGRQSLPASRVRALSVSARPCRRPEPLVRRWVGRRRPSCRASFAGALLEMVLDVAAGVERLVLERLGGGSERVGRRSAFRRLARALLLA